MRRFLPAFLGLGLAAAAPLRAAELFPAAPLDQVSVRTLPACRVVEAEVTGTLAAGWTRGFRTGARYAAMVQSGLNTPTVITFPDWDAKPSAEGSAVHFLVACLLDPIPNLPAPKDDGATVRDEPALTVACYAMKGDYSPAQFMLGLRKIQEHLKSHGIPAAGPPRYLYYANTDWMPSFWRIGEVQVPIAAQGR